jgi:predicted RNA binding protein YcfA (HicA-like mRNA interferase family)
VKAVSGRGLCKALEGKGWFLKRIRGSHHIYGYADCPDTIITVPYTETERFELAHSRAS